jgi:hypothetical protein
VGWHVDDIMEVRNEILLAGNPPKKAYGILRCKRDDTCLNTTEINE